MNETKNTQMMEGLKPTASLFEERWDIFKRNHLAYFSFIFLMVLFVFAITIPFDIRDLQLDDLSQRTIPQVIGIEKSITLANVLLFLGAVLGWVCVAYSAAAFTGLLMSYVLTSIILSFVKKETKELYYSGLIDGTIALQAATVILAIYFL
mgnify:CR=1 FL=1